MVKQLKEKGLLQEIKLKNLNKKKSYLMNTLWADQKRID